MNAVFKKRMREASLLVIFTGLFFLTGAGALALLSYAFAHPLVTLSTLFWGVAGFTLRALARK